MDTASDNAYSRYLLDLGVLIKEQVVEAKSKWLASRGTPDADLALGHLMALHAVVTLMQQQADAFGIPQAQMALVDIKEEFFFNEDRQL